jgi:LEA14-like dessication related protein
MVRRFAFVAALALSCLVAGCHSGKPPELRVLGAQKLAGAPRHEVVFVQVTNPASRPMRLTKLEYKFAAQGATLSEGEVPLEREIPARASVVVEVPLEAASEGPMTLSGKLTAELDQIVRIFAVSAQIEPQ